MTANDDDVLADTSQYARAIARWENEGGASKHDTGESDGDTVKPTRVNSYVENGQGASDPTRAIVPGRPERQT